MANLPKLRKVVSKKTGQVKWAVHPSDTIKDALGCRYVTFETKISAKFHAQEIAHQFKAYREKQRSADYISTNSVNGLIDAYKETAAWLELAANSKLNYNDLLKRVLHVPVGQSSTFFSDMLAVNVTWTHGQAIHSTLTEAVSKHCANHTCKVLRAIWFQGANLGLVKGNPFSKMGTSHTRPREVLWEDKYIHKLIDTSDKMGYPSIGTLALLCYELCQRPGDMRQLTWDQYDGRKIRFRQEKTSNKFIKGGHTPPLMELDVSGWLKERLSKVERFNSCDNIVVYEGRGKNRSRLDKRPYTRWKYNEIRRPIQKAAGIPMELQMRDFRRTGATEIAESGATEDELRSVTGHQSREVLSIYVRPSVKMAATAMGKREQARLERQNANL